jgi:hypothetical protein
LRQTSKAITISQKKWDEIKKATVEARKNAVPLKAFFLYVKRGAPTAVVDTKEVPVNLLKTESNSGPIFRWAIPLEQHLAYYPPKREGIRYGGTALMNQALLQQPFGLSLHYAYWIGADFKLSVAINISLWCNSLGDVNYKACYVNAKETNGEFVECIVEPKT